MLYPALMANNYMDKVLYYRETTNGKTKWVKVEGATYTAVSKTLHLEGFTDVSHSLGLSRGYTSHRRQQE